MDFNLSSGSEIQKFFNGKHIFITGATGFVGKVLIQKLFDSCGNLEKIYVLIRAKKALDSQSRFDELLNFEIFDDLKKRIPNIREKLVLIEGDLVEPNLGIRESDEQLLAKNVNIVFHTAATVRFNEPLNAAVNINVKPLSGILNLARKMKNLEAFVHVSTAYANCDRKVVKEIIYDPPLPSKPFVEMLNWMDKSLIDKITPFLIDKRPNTYTYTKALAEYLIKESEKDLPMVIVRPSIIGAAWKEPAGWIDNYQGLTFILLSVGKGLLYSMLGDGNATCDIVPVDMTVNFLITAAWYRSIKKSNEALVFNFTSGASNPIKYKECIKFSIEYFKNNPFEQRLPFLKFKMTTSKRLNSLKVFYRQRMPAYFFDISLRLRNKQPRFVHMQKKIQTATRACEFFCSNDWVFEDKNVEDLNCKLNNIDKKAFNFDLKTLNWLTYFEQYCFGVKKYLLKESCNDETKPLKS